jgi:hypothetical protein
MWYVVFDKMMFYLLFIIYDFHYYDYFYACPSLDNGTSSSSSLDDVLTQLMWCLSSKEEFDPAFFDFVFQRLIPTAASNTDGNGRATPVPPSTPHNLANMLWALTPSKVGNIVTITALRHHHHRHYHHHRSPSSPPPSPSFIITRIFTVLHRHHHHHRSPSSPPPSPSSIVTTIITVLHRHHHHHRSPASPPPSPFSSVTTTITVLHHHRRRHRLPPSPLSSSFSIVTIAVCHRRHHIHRPRSSPYP